MVDTGHFIAAACLLAYMPSITEIDGGLPKEPLVALVALGASLGVLASAGAISDWVAPALYLSNGLQLLGPVRDAASRTRPA